jgi:membrane protein implicated in regulation of membrane protease activity
MNLTLLILAVDRAADIPGAAGAATFETIYLICALVGLLFTVISFVLSGVFDSGDVGDHDFDMGHDVDVGHDVDLGHGADVGHDGSFDTHSGDTVALGPISPTTISMFITAFGAVGYLALVYMGMQDWYLHLPLASAAGFAVAALLFWTLYKIFQVTVSSSEAVVNLLPGTRGEVLVPIPAGGLGEVAYTARGTRYNSPARSADGKPIPQFSSVIIKRVVGGTCVVTLESETGSETGPKPSPDTGPAGPTDH